MRMGKHSTFNVQRSTSKDVAPRASLDVECSGLNVLRSRSQRGSVLIIVLWVAFGLVALTIYFANSMSLELRAASNRVSAVTSDQAIEGAARYISQLLANQVNNGSNGIVPDSAGYGCQAVPVGDAHFWPQVGCWLQD